MGDRTGLTAEAEVGRSRKKNRLGGWGKINIRKDMLSRAHDDQPRSLHNNIKCSSKKTFLKVSKYYRLVSTFVRSCH